tara:strand:+ start:183 stop:845 length:663 start_codon:yes stop_codon:yes gene_type:complete
MGSLVVSSAPSSEPLTLSDTKSYLRVDHSSDDSLITSLIIASRQLVEEHTGRALITQTLHLFLDGFNEAEDPLWEGVRTGPYLNFYKNYIDLPRPPVASVTSIHTFDDDDNSTLYATANYYVNSAREPARIVLRTGSTWPTALRVANAIKVVYEAGYGSAGAVPNPIKQAMLQLVAHMYEQRGDMADVNGETKMPILVKKLLAPYVVHKGLGTSSLMAIG